MSEARTQIRGRILGRRLGQGPSGLRVEVWDRTLMFSGAIAQSTTDDEGRFRVELDEAEMRAALSEREPELCFRVFAGPALVTATDDSVVWVREVGDAELVIDVDDDDHRRHHHRRHHCPPSPVPEVHGTVRRADGSVVPATIVRLFARTLRSETRLGEARTDCEGVYHIRWKPSAPSLARKPTFDFVVRAYDENGKVIGTATRINAPIDATIDINLPLPPSTMAEFDRTSAALQPLLKGVKASSLTDDEIAYLAQKVAGGALVVRAYIAAARLNDAVGILLVVGYAFARQGLPTSVPSLLSVGRDGWRAALMQAIAARIIAPSLADSVDGAVADVARRLQGAVLSTKPSAGAVGAVLATGVSDPAVHERLFTLYAQHQGTVEEFWNSAAADSQIGPKRVADLQWTIQIAALTSNHVPLIQSLQQARAHGHVAQIRDLAFLDDNAWAARIEEAGGDPPPNVPGKDAAERKQNWARALTANLARSFPTAAFARQLGRDDGRAHADVVRFIRANATFEFQSVYIDAYVSSLSSPPAPELVDRLKWMQRLFTITPTFNHVKVLIDANLPSARAIARMGRDGFAARYAEALGGTAAADEVFARADRLAATAMALYGKFAPALNALEMNVTRSPS